MANKNLEEDAMPGSHRSDGRSGPTTFEYTFPDGASVKFCKDIGHVGSTIQIGTNNNLNISVDKAGKTHRKAKKPLSDRKESPPRILLQKISNDIQKDDAVRLGKMLGLTDVKIDEIDHDFHQEGCSEVKYQILNEWKRKDSQATIARLAYCLNEIGRGDISDKLPH